MRKKAFSFTLVNWLLYLFLFAGSLVTHAQSCPDVTIPTATCTGSDCGGGSQMFVTGGSLVDSSYIWIFTHPNGQTKDTIRQREPVYIFAQGGAYTVELKLSTPTGILSCKSQTVNVSINGFGEFKLTPDNNLGPQREEICENSEITLKAEFEQGAALPEGPLTYLWSTGATTETIRVREENCYSLTITDRNGCSRSARVEVTIYDVPPPIVPDPNKERSRWYFGDGAGVIFKGAPDGTITGNSKVPEGTAAISTTKGKFLFYTDGKTVYDTTGTPMRDLTNRPVTGTNGLKGGDNTTQGVAIVPQPGCASCNPPYFIFTTTDITGAGSQLYYSVVDMAQNNGLGVVTKKNIPLPGATTERVVYIEAEADTTQPNRPETTWIITHDFNSSVFRVYPLTPTGIQQPPITSDIGVRHGSHTQAGEGYMKVYDKKIVVVVPGDPTISNDSNKIQVFDFDRKTGKVSGPPKTIAIKDPPKAYGVELIGDSTLYVSLSGTMPDSSFIYGYNLNKPTDKGIDSTKRKIGGTNQFVLGALQLDPDGNRLFIAQDGQNYLGEITGKENLATAMYDDQAIQLTNKSKLGLPNTKPPTSSGLSDQGLAFAAPPCAFVGDSVVIDFQALPNRAGGDPAKSSYEWSFTQLSGVVGPIKPSSLSTYNPTVQFPGPGSYEVRLKIWNDCMAYPGESFKDTINILPYPPKLKPITKLGCKNPDGTNVKTPLDPYEGITGIPPNLKYTWISSQTGKVVFTGPVLVSDTAGSYQVIVSNGSCSQSTIINLSFAPPLKVDLGLDQSVCRSTTISLNAGNPGPDMRYRWVRVDGVTETELPATSQILIVSANATTTYRVTVTDLRTRCTGTDDVTVNVNLPPAVQVEKVENAVACGGDGRIQLKSLNLLPPNPIGFYYLWELPDGSVVGGPLAGAVQPTNLPVPVGVTRITVTNIQTGCDTTLTVTVNNDVLDGVKYDATPPVITCGLPLPQEFVFRRTDAKVFEITEYQIFGPDPSSGTNTILVFWSKNNGGTGTNPNLSNDIIFRNTTGLQPGLYSIEGKYGNGLTECKFANSFEIKPPLGKPTVTASFEPAGCGRVALIALASPVSASVNWTGPNNQKIDPVNGQFFATALGKYIVTVGTSPCTATATIDVTVVPPTAKYNQTIKTPDPVCVNQPITLTAPIQTGWDTYIWVAPDKRTFVGNTWPNETPTHTNTATYKLIVRSATGCADSVLISVIVTPTPPAPQVSTPVFICAGSPRPTLKAAGTNLIWYSDSDLGNPVGTGASFTPPINTRIIGSYRYYVTQSTTAISQTTASCPSEPALVTVMVIPAPVINLGRDRTVCDGTTVTLDPGTVIPNAAYVWNSGQKTPTLTVTRKGTYILTVTSGGCSSADTVVVDFIPAPKVALPRREVPVCVEKSDVRTARLDAGPGSNFTYEWRKPGESLVLSDQRVFEAALQGGLPQTFVVTVRNGTVCSASDTVRVVDKCEPRLVVPQAFTPNDDGANDKLEVFREYIGAFKMLVYNRWGEVIFATESFESLWDGTYKGQKVPPGTYTWKAVYTAEDYPERPPVEVRGGILVLR